MIALLCAISDLLLICAGIFGGSALLMQSPWLLALVTWGGVAFFIVVRLWRAENGDEQQPRTGKRGSDEAGALENYRHYAGGHLAESARVSGYVCGSRQPWRAVGDGAEALVCLRYHQRLILMVLWAGLLVAWLAPRLRTAKAQRIINVLVGLVMWVIAFQLAKDGFAMCRRCLTKPCPMDFLRVRAKLAGMRLRIDDQCKMEKRQ